MSDLTLRKIEKTPFMELYQKLVLNDELSIKEKIALLEIALIFLSDESTVFKRLGYRIIVMYSNRFKDYKPLYEITTNNGLYPIAHTIVDRLVTDYHSINVDINEAFAKKYDNGHYYQTEEQFGLFDFYCRKIDESLTVIAPTSYGKTELIVSTIKKSSAKRICIITPTKSLLSQTRKRILSAGINSVNKIVIHPDMFNPNDEMCIAVLTQERLYRLLSSNPSYSFDLVIIDEAHNILQNDSRNLLLASAIIVLNKRNANVVFKFLTPFVSDCNNLKVKYTTYDLSKYFISEYLKTEKYYVYDIQGKSGLLFYDQFLNHFINDNTEATDQTEIGFIINHAGKKNIVYFNKPSDIEFVANELINTLPDIAITTELQKVIDCVSGYIDPDYTLVKCLKKGIVFHHGSVPDVIRQYIEYQYAHLNEIKYILTTSTLLEGINLPAEKLFIMDNRKGRKHLSDSALINLIGRICRFGDIFKQDVTDLNKLEPEIYFVVGKFYRKDSNFKTFISENLKVEHNVRDDCQNVLLKAVEINEDNMEDAKTAEEYVENTENGTIENYLGRVVHTPIGKSCIKNSITEFDVFENEEELQSLIDSLKQSGLVIENPKNLLFYINLLFLSHIETQKHNNLARLGNDVARRYYEVFIKQKIDSDSYSRMINKTLYYWSELIQKQQNTIVYVGRWGDLCRGGYEKLWTDISEKSHSELINLAIVRVKEEQDFIDNTLMKFVEVIQDMNLINPDFYLKLKYGVSNQDQIVLIRNGISLTLSELLTTEYRDYIDINATDNVFNIDRSVIEKMYENQENDILIYEAKSNIIYE